MIPDFAGFDGNPIDRDGKTRRRVGEGNHQLRDPNVEDRQLGLGGVSGLLVLTVVSRSGLFHGVEHLFVRLDVFAELLQAEGDIEPRIGAPRHLNQFAKEPQRFFEFPRLVKLECRCELGLGSLVSVARGSARGGCPRRHLWRKTPTSDAARAVRTSQQRGAIFQSSVGRKVRPAPVHFVAGLPVTGGRRAGLAPSG